MKKWLKGLLSGSPDEKKKGQKGMSKAKPAKAAKTAKAAKPAAKAKPEAKAKAKAEPKTKTELKAKPELKKLESKPKPEAKAEEKKPTKAAKSAPVAEKEAPAPKPKKGAKQAEPTLNAAGIVDTASPENKKKWRELREKFSKEKAPAYNMASQFEPDQPLEHKVLGWGYILTNNNDRLEVLFETGVKILISNYRS